MAISLFQQLVTHNIANVSGYMNPLKLFTTPEYAFRPSQAWKRFLRGMKGPPPKEAVVKLPWGDRIRIHPNETIGSDIWFYGIFDLLVAETLWRLCDRGETALDIGANIGQMTSLLRQRVGANGRVHSFEPHPDLLPALLELAEDTQTTAAPVTVHPFGLSSRAGEALLDPGADWENNQGTSRIVTSGPSRCHRIQLRQLDSVLSDSPVSLIKIDVEGHEQAVFDGATTLFTKGAIRDIVFEDLNPHPSALSEFLVRQNFEIVRLHSTFWGPCLLPSDSQQHQRRRNGDNFLATRNLERARQRFVPTGWQVLSARR